MCGIAGIRRVDGGPVPEAALRAMTDALAHRGPDDSGFWTAPGVGFGHRRLAIIDPTGPAQPMADPSGTRHVCFNGEIFNYRRLRSELGRAWRTDGDTEVLLALFDRYGPDGVSQLTGQFAYALHDERDGALWLFRDRLGVLPLYWTRVGSTFLFASEIKALLAVVPDPPEVDQDALGDYLARRAVPAPRTLYRGIHKLAPGHRLRLSADGGLEITRWWRWPPVSELTAYPPAEALARVDAALDTAVQRALVADVPVGCYLSGGVDSSLISARVAATRGPAGLHTFAAGFGDARTDELPHARMVAGHLGTTHHEVLVTAQDFARWWEPLTWHRDAPLSEPADVAVHALARRAREHVTVVLSGEGSDELFAGYPKHRMARLGAALGHLPAPVRSGLAGLAEVLPAGPGHRPRIAARALSGTDAAARDLGWFAPFTEAERHRLLGRPVATGGDRPSGRDPLDRMLRADLQSWLPDNLLERGDRMTMAASVELRPPFLDHELVETAMRLPSALKIHRGVGKWPVKALAHRVLPAHIVDRPKAGFKVPLEAWFRDGLAELAQDRLTSPRSFVHELLDRRAVSALLHRHTTGRRNEDIRLWTLINLDVWYERCVAGVRPAPEAAALGLTRAG